MSQPSLSQIEFSTAFQDFIVALGATTGPEYGPAKAAMEKIIATSAKPTASASPSSSSAPTQSKVTDPDVAANDENVKDTDISSSSQKLVGSVGVVFLASLFFL